MRRTDKQAILNCYSWILIYISSDVDGEKSHERVLIFIVSEWYRNLQALHWWILNLHLLIIDHMPEHTYSADCANHMHLAVIWCLVHKIVLIWFYYIEIIWVIVHFLKLLIRLYYSVCSLIKVQWVTEFRDIDCCQAITKMFWSDKLRYLWEKWQIETADLNDKPEYIARHHTSVLKKYIIDHVHSFSDQKTLSLWFQVFVWCRLLCSRLILVQTFHKSYLAEFSRMCNIVKYTFWERRQQEKLWLVQCYNRFLNTLISNPAQYFYPFLAGKSISEV